MIFQSDVIIREIILLGINDIRNNIWLLDYLLDDFTTISWLQQKYGEKQIKSAKEWFLNNNIDVYMQFRKDTERMPCVTITLGSSNEKVEMKHMADASTETITLMPNQIGRPIPFVIKPFIPTSYDVSAGQIGVPDSVDLSSIGIGMILVNPANGQGTQIIGFEGQSILIQPGLENLDASKLAIVPQYQFYTARLEHSFFQETYQIGCHAPDPQSLLWLHAIVLYSLLRYREGLLEANGFTESVINSSDMFINEYFSGMSGQDEILTRNITLTGQVENKWVKSPWRTIENTQIKAQNQAAIGPTNVNGVVAGIQILSNITSTVAQQQQTDWSTIQDLDDFDEEDT